MSADELITYSLYNKLFRIYELANQYIDCSKNSLVFSVIFN